MEGMEEGWKRFSLRKSSRKRFVRGNDLVKVLKDNMHEHTMVDCILSKVQWNGWGLGLPPLGGWSTPSFPSPTEETGSYFETVHFTEERLAMKFIEALNAISCKDRDNVCTSIDTANKGLDRTDSQMTLQSNKLMGLDLWVQSIKLFY